MILANLLYTALHTLPSYSLIFSPENQRWACTMYVMVRLSFLAIIVHHFQSYMSLTDKTNWSEYQKTCPSSNNFSLEEFLCVLMGNKSKVHMIGNCAVHTEFHLHWISELGNENKINGCSFTLCLFNKGVMHNRLCRRLYTDELFSLSGIQ